MKIIDDLYQEDINYATRFRNLHIIFSSFTGALSGKSNKIIEVKL